MSSLLGLRELLSRSCCLPSAQSLPVRRLTLSIQDPSLLYSPRVRDRAPAQPDHVVRGLVELDFHVALTAAHHMQDPEVDPQVLLALDARVCPPGCPVDDAAEVSDVIEHVRRLVLVVGVKALPAGIVDSCPTCSCAREGRGTLIGMLGWGAFAAQCMYESSFMLNVCGWCMACRWFDCTADS
jgi:hypothetical protein